MMNSLSRFDKRAIVICLFCIAAVMYLIAHPEMLSKDSNSEKDSIGQVTQVNSDIRLKTKQDYFWKKTFVNNYVSKGDSIYTGNQSSTEVKLKDGKILKISENSLIRFTTVDKNLSIDLAFGKVEAAGIDKTFTITDCGQQYTVDAKGASFELTKNKECGNFDLQVSKGTVLVDKKPVVKKVSKKSIPKTIFAEVQQEKKIAILQPAEEKVSLQNPSFITTDQNSIFKSNSSLALNWNAVSHADYYDLEVANNPNFTQASSYKVLGTNYNYNPEEPGLLYFKVTAATNNGIKSGPSLPIQIALNVPSIELNNKLIQAEYKAKNPNDFGQKKNFDVSWSKIDSAEKYVVEVDKDPTFSKPTQIVSRTPSSVIAVPQTGNFHYRVSAYDKQGRKISSTQEPGTIDYKKVFSLARPILNKAFKNTSYYFQKEFAQFIWLKWATSSQTATNSFRIEFSKDDKFQDKIVAFNTIESKFLVKSKLDRGHYFWRVRTEDSKLYSEWSETGHISILTQQSKGNLNNGLLAHPN